MSYFSVGNVNKCAVIGCYGVGAATAHALCQSKAVDAVVLIDSDKRLADGLAADLCCAQHADTHIDIWAGEYADLYDCAIIFLASGQSRLHENAHADLTALNLPIIRKSLTDMAAFQKDAIIIVVSEPCDIMTQVVLRYAGVPHHKIMGIGTLPQTLYLRKLLGKYLNVDPKQLDAMILGQSDMHGTLCLDTIHVCGICLDQYLDAIRRRYDRAMLESLFNDTLHAFSRAEDAKGRAEYAIAHACKLVAECILNDSNTILPLCTATDCISEMAHSCISLPCLVNHHGAHPLAELPISPAEFEQLKRSAARLHAQIVDAEKIFVQRIT